MPATRSRRRISRWKSWTDLNRARTRHALQDVAGARADYDLALRSRPKYAHALHNRATRLRAGEMVLPHSGGGKSLPGETGA